MKTKANGKKIYNTITVYMLSIQKKNLEKL